MRLQGGVRLAVLVCALVFFAGSAAGLSVATGYRVASWPATQAAPASSAGPTATGSGTIQGIVTNAETRRPIAGAVIRMMDAAGSLLATTTADSKGAYQMTGLRDGLCSIEVTAQDHEPAARTAVSVVAGQSLTVNLTLYQYQTIDVPADPPGRASTMNAAQRYLAWTLSLGAAVLAVLFARRRLSR